MKYLSSIIITAIIVFFATTIYVNKTPEVVIKETVKVDTVFITDTVIKTKLVPKYVTLPNDTIYIPTDNDSLIKLYKEMYVEFNSRKLYNETYDLDSLGVIIVESSIYRNNIDTQFIAPLLTLPLTTITREVYKQQNHFYVGLNVGYVHHNVHNNALLANISYINPKYFVNLQYDFINKIPYIGVGYKIFSYDKKSK